MTKQKVHSTNYFDTLIEVAEDTKVSSGTKPSSKGAKKTVAEMQYELIADNPYKFTSDEVIFKIFASRNDLTTGEYEDAKKVFFSKGQPCFRASPLTKSYGFGVHSDNEGKIAIFGMDTEHYQKLIDAPDVKKVKAMRSSRK